MHRLLPVVIAALLMGCSHPAANTDVPAEAYVAGQSYFGANGYIEYIAGNAPVIFTAPHGGTLQPASIPDRTADRCGGAATTTTDLNTADLARAMQRRYFARFGTYPHVVIANIARRKVDANRTAPEATCGNPEAESALREWHSFIDVAKRADQAVRALVRFGRRLGVARAGEPALFRSGSARGATGFGLAVEMLGNAGWSARFADGEHIDLVALFAARDAQAIADVHAARGPGDAGLQFDLAAFDRLLGK